MITVIAIPLNRSRRLSKAYVPVSWSVTGVTHGQIRQIEIAWEGEKERWMDGERERERDYGERLKRETKKERTEKELKILYTRKFSAGI